MAPQHVRAVVPMKPLAQCKLRLAPALDAAQRGRLALAMLERVLRAAQAAHGIDEVVVLGGDAAVRALSGRLGVAWQVDSALNLNAALQGFYAETCALGPATLLYLAGDLPYLKPEDIAALLAELDAADVVLGAGARGGTNAVLLRGGVPFAFDLGGESLERHRAQAEARGLRWRIVRTPALQSDVDTPADLEQLRRADPALWRAVSGLEEPAGSGAS